MLIGSNGAELQYSELDYEAGNLTEAQQLATDAVMAALSDNPELDVAIATDAELEEMMEGRDDDTELMAANDRFNEQLDDFSEGRLAKEQTLSLGMPSRILVGYGIANKEMTIKQSTLREHLRKHNLTISDIKNLVLSLEHPMMLYDWGTKAPSHIIVTNQTTIDGRKISIAIKISQDGEVQEINEVSSVHGKESEFFKNGMKNAKEGGLEEALRYVDKEKALDWLALSPPKGDDTTKQEPNSLANVIINFDNSKFWDEKSVNSFENAELSIVRDSKTIGKLEKGRRLRCIVVWLS